MTNTILVAITKVKGNSRNGYYKRSLHTVFANITLKIPYNRLGQFQNKLLTPYNRNFDNLEKNDYTAYQKGVIIREIVDIIENCMVATIRHKLSPI